MSYSNPILDGDAIAVLLDDAITSAWRENSTIYGITIDSAASSPSDNDILVYNVSAAAWILQTKPSGGGGTVTNVSVVDANGFTGSVTDATGNADITIETNITAPVLKGTGTAIVTAVPGTDYQAPGDYITSAVASATYQPIGDYVTSASLGALAFDDTVSAGTLDNTGVTAGSYGAADTVGTFTVDSNGRLTLANDVTIDITAAQVNDFGEAVDDQVGNNLIQNGVGLEWTYDDGANTLTGNVTGAHLKIVTLTTTVFAVTDEDVILVDTSAVGGNVTVNLPQSSARYISPHSHPLIIKNKSATGNTTVDITPDGVEEIDGDTGALSIKKEVSLTLLPDGSDWWIV